MRIEVKVPTVGESITEGILAEWKVTDGAFVQADEPLFELETDKVSMTVTADKAGRITLSAKAGDTVQIGSSVAYIETEASAPSEQSKFQNPNSKIEEPPLSPTAGIHTLKANLKDLAPSVRRIVAEEHLDPVQIVGTGKGGRITKEDAVRASMAQVGGEKVGGQTPPPPPPASEGGKGVVSASEGGKGAVSASEEGKGVVPASEGRTISASASGRETLATTLQIQNPKSKIQNLTTRRPMTALRHRIAERMVESQHNSATLTTFNEVDMSAVMTARTHLQEPFQARFGIKLGIMSFFVKAAVEALKAVPEVNAWIDGDEIVENHFFDIGVAVSTERGLVVPVIRNADALSFAELETQIAHYAEKARNRTITLDELQGGVFTISNGGVFGSMLSTPILNPPQPAILGLHGIKKRPVVIGDSDQIVVRPMMNLALSYDHRLIDGRESVAFLKKIVECIEMPERLMMGV
jgi:2-oxoglutarate dehydrogenase E2 component (dihydrolipoamide succinyltransferase)